MPELSLNQPVLLEQACASLPELWSPRVVARVNDQYVKVARVQGEFPWHSHAGQDELFLVLRGALTIGRGACDGGPVTLQAGEIFVVPCGVRHNTSAAEETWIALVETVRTEHTGTEMTSMTQSIAEQLGMSSELSPGEQLTMQETTPVVDRPLGTVPFEAGAAPRASRLLMPRRS